MRDEHPCGRCGRLTAHDDLRLHTTRERLREFTRRAPLATPPVRLAVHVQVKEARVTEPPQAEPSDSLQAADLVPEARATPPAAIVQRGRAVAYRWVTHAHVLCPECHDVVAEDAGRLHDHDRRRFVIMILAAIALAALMWLSFTTFMPNWIAAFWRNGAGGR